MLSGQDSAPVQAGQLRHLPEQHLPQLAGGIEEVDEAWMERARPPHVNIGPREPLETLGLEFRYNQQFQEKVRWLSANRYTGWRRILGDGNCFYRAVGFALLELLANPQRAQAEFGAAAMEVRASRASALHARLSEVQLHDTSERLAHDALLARVAQLRKPGGSWPQWEARVEPPELPSADSALHRSLRLPRSSRFDAAQESGSMDGGAPNLDLALVRGIRSLAAAYLLNYGEDPEQNGGLSFDTVALALGYGGIAAFCEEVVLPMGSEVQSIALKAVARSLGITIRVVYLDGENMHRADVTCVDFTADGSESRPDAAQGISAAPLIHVQLRPGHYDLLYPGGD